MSEKVKKQLFTEKQRKEWNDITRRIKKSQEPKVPQKCTTCIWVIRSGKERFFCPYIQCFRRDAS